MVEADISCELMAHCQRRLAGGGGVPRGTPGSSEGSVRAGCRAAMTRASASRSIRSGTVSMLARSWRNVRTRSEEHTSELQSLMRISYAVFCLKKKKHTYQTTTATHANTSIIITAPHITTTLQNISLNTLY